MCNTEKTTMIEVKDLKEVNKGNLKAIFNVILTTPDNVKITIYNLRLMVNKNGFYFVGMPAKKGTDEKWYNIVYLDRLTSNSIEDTVIRLLKLEQPAGDNWAPQDDDQLPF